MRESDRKSGLQYHFNVTEFGAYAIEFYFAQINGGDEAKFSVYVSKRCIFLSLSSRDSLIHVHVCPQLHSDCHS